ncbi:pyridoxal phosphate-dependent aminotransferase [Spirosoma sp. KUDC1026]|uniref:pyridoxal phosphate-dependent aminotransferase n=1 Tax=Spirosoma sp. KUDC1026 TaxID=2745947 RepID=UPI00159B9BB9|nr:aminotransferase class I/II-fold pyridoxal phosphate-dependent enzyme [Spirosoma sp. KUDC1026]QKZ15388.1 pyridoxal phosphate-dependent class II aminotransferase [Spirosoma sp. KUDC1026]
MLHGHGDDRYRYATDVRADFSTNVWYGGEPTGLKEYLFSQWDSINRYPEVLAESLARQIAYHHQVDTDQVLVNSGTTESIYLIAQAYARRTTTIVIPTFAEYEDACRMHGHSLHFMNWDQLAQLPQMTSDLVFICNPNNPTGAVFGQLADWIAQNPQTLFVVDEAFIEFTDQLDTAISLLNQFSNVVIMRSLTKAYAIPGLRLGYVVGSSLLIDRLKAVKQPWTVNAMALAAGRHIFDNFDSVQLPLSQLLADKQLFINALLRNSAIQVYDSGTHFFLARTQKGTAAQLKTYLIENHGLLIRDASNFRGLEAGHFRVCTLSPEKNALLLDALTAWNN